MLGRAQARQGYGLGAWHRDPSRRAPGRRLLLLFTGRCRSLEQPSRDRISIVDAGLGYLPEAWARYLATQPNEFFVPAGVDRIIPLFHTSTHVISSRL